jgi:hypothetical protein
MATRQARYDHINALRGSLPALSQSALSALLTKAKRGELPTVCSRPVIRAARDTTATQMTPHGPLCTQIELANVAESGVVPIDVCLPAPSLYVVAQCKYMSGLIERTLATYPCSPLDPWGMVLYCDEVVPGNVMRSENTKKLMAVYWSILEFGAASLCKESNWFTASIATTTDLGKVATGVTQLIAELLTRTFTGAESISRGGLRLRLHNGNDVRIFMEFRIFLADEAALHDVFMCKGAGGIKLCVLCMNIYARDWLGFKDNPRGTEGARPYCDVHHLRGCVLHTKGTHVAVLEKLRDYKASLNAEEYKKKETQLGFTLNARSLFLDARLRDVVDAPSQLMFDWAHCILQGILGVVLYAVLCAISPEHARPKAFRDLHAFLVQWTFPRRLDSKTSGARAIFSPKRINSHLDAYTVKLTMSEALALVPLLRHWLLTVVIPERPELLPICNCVLLLLLFVQMLLASVRFTVDHVLLADVYEQFFNAFNATIGRAKTIPKFHFLIHVPRHVRDFGFALNCIVAERKHKVVKAFADVNDNPRGLARSLLREVTAQHIAEQSSADHLNMAPRLLGKVRKASAELQAWLSSLLSLDTTFYCSGEARVSSFLTIAVGDLVVVSETHGADEFYVGRVWWFVDAADGVLLAIVDKYTNVAMQRDYSVWEEGNDPQLELFESVFDVLIHKRDADGRVTVIHPYSLRRVLP